MQAYWIDNIDRKNYEICLTTRVGQAKEASIAVIAKYTYNLFINGAFVCYGPARTADGYARIDRIDISRFLTQAENVISLYCLSVETKTLCFAAGASFLGCELTLDGRTVDARAFSCYLMNDRVDRVERMSAQRGYVEVYEQSADRTAFADCKSVRLSPRKTPQLLERRVPFSRNERVSGTEFARGCVTFDNPHPWGACLVNFLSDCTDGDFYPLKDCRTVLYRELEQMRFHPNAAGKCRYISYDLGQTYSGKIEIRLNVAQDTNLWVTYDDLLTDGCVFFGREQIIHGLKWTLKKGNYTLHSAEVYAMRYLSLIFDGNAAAIRVSVITVENPAWKEVSFADAKLAQIYRAAQRTFRQNAYDLYTDCPSRERAGWLCDSYFTAKAERFFTGDNSVERNFLENYLLYDGAAFPHKGILPSCFPSVPKHPNDFIPNWILWFLVELGDFVARTGDLAFALRFRDKITDILAYFRAFENEYGFLENLQGWVFLEWSKANDFMDGVNFPSNMLYYGALRSAGTLLDDRQLLEKASALREAIRAFSFDGDYFYDNALRTGTTLTRTEYISETCQYFAAFFDIAPDRDAFVEKLAEKFSPFAAPQDPFCPSPMFIGYVLRLSLLFDAGAYRQLLAECREKFLPMAERTGTIWEFFDESASCNHGFGSIVGYFVAEAEEKCRNATKI